MSQQIEAGVCVCDITPPPGAPLWGYGNRTGPATGTLDSLCARAVCFRAGDSCACIVSLDLGRVPVASVLERIRARARDAGVDHVIFSATHTHHAPVMEFREAPYMPGIEAAIGDAVEGAARSVVPARIGVGTATVDIGHNRRFVTPDGRCLMRWRNQEHLPTEPVDKEASVIRIDTDKGEPLAVIVHYACHPVVMGPSNLQYSGDYVGECVRLVSERTGATCVFLQGGAGDINPYLDKTPIDGGGVEAMRSTGRTCADAVYEAWSGIAPQQPQAPCVQYAQMRVETGVRWDFSDPQIVETYLASHVWIRELIDAYRDCLRTDLTVPVSALVLNQELAFAAVPGEFFVKFQMELKSSSPYRYALLCGYADDFHLYFPTIRDALAGGYGGTMASYVGLGAGETVLTAAKLMLARMTGKVRPDCVSGDFAIEDDENFR
ncbi:MAG: neutral/alkaline non-lysosomal ceramidase N-terminal domain-containing protein [Candidatus Hydrogenedentes bacterium]|nr:neutral/alkaline non-lysosomal ceramidase N-terminal domain-containing protein [Candidatus Hydrogenedentota bacterium]